MEKELIGKEMIRFDVEAKTKEDVIQLIANAMEADERLFYKAGYVEDVLKREESSSTAIGFMVATPHSKSVHVKVPSLAFVRLKDKILWDGEEEVNMVFQIGVPSPGQGDRHLEILAKLFRQLVHDEFRNTLLEAKTQEEVVTILGDF